MNENLLTGHPAFGKRIGAFFVDNVIIMLLALPPTFFIPGLENEDASGLMTRVFITTAIAVGGLLFRDVFGRSLGKLLFGVYIVNADDPEKRVTIGQRIKRNVPLLFWPVELIATRRDPDYWRLGDRWAHTLVAADTRKKVPTMLLAVLGGALMIGFILFTVISTMMNDGSYDAAVEYIESQEEIVSAVGGIERFGLPSGSIHTSNGYGSARLEIPVIGDDGRMTVEVTLTKEPDEEWVVEEIDW